MRSAAVALSLALLCLSTHAATAQPIPLPPGQDVVGVLDGTDSLGIHGGRFETYAFDGVPGVRYRLAMASDDFRTMLAVGRENGGETLAATELDLLLDGRETAVLTFVVPEPGRYVVRAHAGEREDGGPFTLRLDTATIREGVREIAVGDTVAGEIMLGDGGPEIGDWVYDMYRFQGRAGQRLYLGMEMETTPTAQWIVVGEMAGGRFLPLDQALFPPPVYLTLPRTQEYVVQVSGGTADGPYRLVVRERPPASALRPVAIRRGETIAGRLDEGDAETPEGLWVDAYDFAGRAGEAVSVSLFPAAGEHSHDVAPGDLVLGRMVDGRMVEIARAADAEEDKTFTGAKLRADLPADGDYRILVVWSIVHAAGYQIRLQ